jgi:alpha-galactosidase
MSFPRDPGDRATGLELVRDQDGFPVLVTTTLLGGGPSGAPLLRHGPGLPLLGEHSRGRYTRPHLRGHRSGGRDWSTRFSCTSIEEDTDLLRIELTDQTAALGLIFEAESLPGGSLRLRHTLTNDGPDDYLLEGLEVVVPVPDHLVEVLDFTGRHEHERQPQRHALTDGLWLRESRAGRPGLGSATLAVLGSPDFSTTYGEVLGVHVAWSGSSVLRVERDAATGATIGAGELLMPGEVRLAPGESYATPWVHVVAADDGLDGLAAALHTHQRSLPAHPAVQPVVLNVWEAVYFDHDLDRLTAIADRAAAVGVERFVLDDGWFLHRRDDTGGLGDWRVDPAVWPDGLAPLVQHVRGLGMQFGLWIEPEMVNPDSDLYREHPDWILSTGGRVPLLHRHQLVLDLSRDEVREHLFTQIDAVLSSYDIGAVKWDHNRDLLEAGSAALGGAAAVHRQTLAFYRLLDDLRAAHPRIDWESCASGGGRIDLGVIEKVQRFWASDMTDALARQQIQRWTTQLLAP